MLTDVHVQRWVDRLLGATDRRSRVVVAAGLAAALATAYLVAYSLGGAGAFAPSVFLLVILVGAVRFGYPGALLTSIGAAILVGPLMPLDVKTGTPQETSVWVTRSIMFLLVGLTTTALVDRARAGQTRELALAQQERDLAVRKAAVVATVAHEFRSPLTVINGVARMLQYRGAVPAEFESLFRGLMDSTDRLIDLVGTMGAVLDGRAQPYLRTEPLVTQEVVATVVAKVAVRDAHSRVHPQIQAGAEFVVTDKDMLEQLLRHVVENALKFSPSDQPVEVNVVRRGDQMVFDVLDRGPGIPDDILERSDPFRQGDQSDSRHQDGLGLGLFAATRLAEMLGGGLDIASRAGGGTRISISITSPELLRADPDQTAPPRSPA